MVNLNHQHLNASTPPTLYVLKELAVDEDFCTTTEPLVAAAEGTDSLLQVLAVYQLLHHTQNDTQGLLS